jgi:non-heme chloroperoxidase
MSLRTLIPLPAILIAAISAATAAPAEEKHVRVGDADIAYVEAGRGDAIVFVHGGLQDYRLWKSHFETFSGRYRTIAYSRRNHFPNATSIDAVPDGAADVHGEDLAAFITALGLQRVHVVAHSSGAHGALFFASNHPDGLLTLVVNEPPASGLLGGSEGGRALAADFNAQLAPAREAFRRGAMANAVQLFVDTVSGPGTYERRSEAAKLMMLDNALAHAADATSTRPRPVFTCAMARRIAAPTLITQGSRSPAFFGAIVDELERCLPDNKRVRIAASHTVPMENPREFDAAVLAFVSKSRRSKPIVSAARNVSPSPGISLILRDP